MLRDSLITNTKRNSNWAGSIKECQESYGFQDVWTSGRVDNEKAFLSSITQRMIQRFKQEWNAKISDSDRFSVYGSFKSVTVWTSQMILQRFNTRFSTLSQSKRFGTLLLDCGLD